MRFEKAKLSSFKRAFCVFALIVVVGVSVSGCMNNGAEQGVNEGRITQPSPAADYMPQGQGAAMNQAASDTAGAGYDWTKNAAQVEAQISQISEISECRVVVTGNTALVAVRFSPAYKGEMTERIREMIAAEVMKADPEITTVAVTADADDVEDVYELSDKMLYGRDMDDLKEEVSEIVRNATTLR